MWTGGAWDWVIVVILYGFGLSLFRALGGIAAAATALQRWGRTTSGRRAQKLGLDRRLSRPR
jgi:hypothetical protein